MLLRLLLILLMDGLLALCALYSGVVLRLGYPALRGEWLEGQALEVAGIFVAISLFSSYLMEVYSLEGKSSKREIFINCLQAAAASFFFLSVVYYLEPSVMLGRGILFLSIALFVLYQFVCHLVVGNVGYATPFAQRVLILGTGEIAKEMGELIATRARRFTLAGFLPCGAGTAGPMPAVPPIEGAPLLRMEEDLLATARKARAGAIVVALSERRGVLPLQEMMQCKLHGIEVLDAPSFYELVQGKLMLERITPSWIIFSSGFRRTALVNSYKRCIDIVLASLGLLLSAPLFPLIALAIKLESPGPVFFKQVRVGAGEKPFTLYKFRSMGRDAEKNGAVWAVKNDARVTRVGRFLRNSRIDEIPQLYNVLKGEMSFIGPRPERPEFVEKLKKDIYYYSKRHTIKPGVTGWAQVRYPYGATTEDAVEKLRYDLYYIKNLSLFLDSQIIFETVKVVLFGRGGR
jgi:sugar transferase (PEP-CTERM system associated)